jgi:hypothetical protein
VRAVSVVCMLCDSKARFDWTVSLAVSPYQARMGLMSASLILRCSQATFTLPAPCCLSLWFATRHAPRRGERGFYIHGYNRFHTAWPFHRHPCGWSCNHWRPDSTSNATQPVEPALSTWATLDMKATTAPVASAIDPGVQMSLRTTLTAAEAHRTEQQTMISDSTTPQLLGPAINSWAT